MKHVKIKKELCSDVTPGAHVNVWGVFGFSPLYTLWHDDIRLYTCVTFSLNITFKFVLGVIK